MNDHLASQLAVYLVADPDLATGDFVATVAAALAGGVTSVQLRAKHHSDRETLALAMRLRALCHQSGALFLVNDRVDLALAAEADGVHLGVDDLPLNAARRLGGPIFIIGYSPDSDEQTASAAAYGADYLGVGPVYGTSSKLDAGAAIGLATITHRVDLAGIPVVGIGGITVENAAAVVDAGAVGVAVASAILRSDHPRNAVTRLVKVVGATRREASPPGRRDSPA